MGRFEARKKIVFTRREPEPGCSPADNVEGRIVSGNLLKPPRSRRGADVRMLHGSSDATLGPRTVAIASLWRLLLQSSAPSRRAWCRRRHFAVVASGGPCVQHSGRGRRCRRSCASLTQHRTQITRENDRLISHFALGSKKSKVARLTW